MEFPNMKLFILSEWIQLDTFYRITFPTEWVEFREERLERPQSIRPRFSTICSMVVKSCTLISRWTLIYWHPALSPSADMVVFKGPRYMAMGILSVTFWEMWGAARWAGVEHLWAPAVAWWVFKFTIFEQFSTALIFNLKDFKNKESSLQKPFTCPSGFTTTSIKIWCTICAFSSIFTVPQLALTSCFLQSGLFQLSGEEFFISPLEPTLEESTPQAHAIYKRQADQSEHQLLQPLFGEHPGNGTCGVKGPSLGCWILIGQNNLVQMMAFIQQNSSRHPNFRVI